LMKINEILTKLKMDWECLEDAKRLCQ
jgi:hypothetical protein